ncbi:DedA family protein [Corynebacterium pseudotuberculosis]|uniref:DedA family protein n=1 Tax=Corynebacterium pseudotuberculosis TaxID=1719 RepID=UPI00065DDE3F|nr:DedA family protein [Corynebacterium pseudotuberculosis]AKP09543.1 DedA family protein [Corynebacterium pseudotuberculosis]
MTVETFLAGLNPVVVYAIVGIGVLIESIGIPIPGETAVIAASLLSTTHAANIHVLWVFAVTCVGAIIGDNIGYSLGHHYGHHLTSWLERRFPRHFSPNRMRYAEHLMRTKGVPVVLGGRFIALLRILAGPLAGVTHMSYSHFFFANAAGAIAWAGTITLMVSLLGRAAHTWITDISWVMGGAVLILGIIALVFGRITGQWLDKKADAHAEENK